MARRLATGTGWVLVAVALAVAMWRDHGDGPWGFIWRPSLLLVGIVAVVVAAPTSTAQRIGALAIGATVLRIAMLPIDVDRLPAAETAERWWQALADVGVGALLIAAVFSTLRSRRHSRGAREFLDGLAVASGGVLVAWVTLANPAIEQGMAPGLAALATAYLPMTIILATLAAELMLEGLARNRGVLLVVASLTSALAGATLRALVQSGVSEHHWQHVSNGLLVAAVVLLCAGVAHPDSPQMFEPLARPEIAVPSARHEAVLMTPLIVGLAVPIVVVATVSPTSNADMIVRGR